MKTAADGRKRAGHVRLDSGSVWVGDPCHMFSQIPEQFKDWEAFLEAADGIKAPVMMDFAKGLPGLGVAAPGGGDGAFDVLVKREDGVITEIKLTKPPKE